LHRPESNHSSTPDLAVVIPALNECPNLEQLLPQVTQAVRALGITAEIVVVDGGSHDGTAQVVERHGCRLIRQQQHGYGGALLTGFAATTAPFVITMDADLAHPPELIPVLWASRNSADVLIASRYVQGGHTSGPAWRRLLSRVLNRAYSRVLSLPIRDLSSGYRLYRRTTLNGLSLRARDFDALEEILIRVYGEGWTIREVPMGLQPRGAGQSHARVLRLGRAFLMTLVRMWRLRNSVLSADYDNRAFDSPLWLQRHWQRTRYGIVMGMLDGRNDILDVGCGSGRIIVDLPDAVGLDIVHRKLRWLRSHHRMVVRGSADQLPFPDASFQCVVCSEVIEHIPDQPEVLGEMTRVLRPGGTLILGTPDYSRRLWRTIEWIYGKVLPDAYADEHITHFTGASLARRLRDAGYDILQQRYLMGSVVIFKARKRVVSRTASNGKVGHPVDLAALPASPVVARGA